MSTSAKRPDLVIAVRRFTDADSEALIAELQAEYGVRYGGPDATPIEPAQFEPPQGLFLVGYLDAVAVACGGWRNAQSGVAEIKRMFVVSGARRQGVARQLLAELERTASAAGIGEVWLETGTQQPEAIAMYAGAGYLPVTAFGHYAEAPQSIHLGKRLS